MGGTTSIRPASVADLPACGTIWRDALNDYFGRLNIPAVPNQLDAVGRLHGHTLRTDPDRFIVADAPARAGEPGAVVGFASAILRGQLWFLSMLFVLPAYQGQGLGRRLLEGTLPDPEDDHVLSASTDAAQPISNGLYAAHGIVPRLPLVHLVGRPTRRAALPPLPPDVVVTPWARVDTLPEELRAIDRAVLGFDHPADHSFAIDSGRHLHLVEREGRVVGYGYASAVGHLGPIAVEDPGLLAPVTAALLDAIEPRGALAVWVPGAAAETFRMLVRAGLRIDGFPILLGWSRPFADFARYLPQSPGLL